MFCAVDAELAGSADDQRAVELGDRRSTQVALAADLRVHGLERVEIPGPPHREADIDRPGDQEPRQYESDGPLLIARRNELPQRDPSSVMRK